MGKNRPGWGHTMVLHLEPRRAIATLGAAFFTMVMSAVVVAAAVYRTDRWPDEWRPEPDVSDRIVVGVGGVAGLLALVGVISVVVNGRRWTTGRRIERLSNEPDVMALMPVAQLAPPSARARVIPELGVDVIKPRKLPRPGRLGRVTIDRNVIGRRPMEIVYLRLFENQPRTRTFVEGAWREFGYVSLLRSAASVSPAEYGQAKKAGPLSSMFIRSPEQLRAELHRADRRPLDKGRHVFRTIAAATIRVRDRHGSYPVTALLCHGAFWTHAVDELLARADLVALDLSGFSPGNAGVQHELQRVIDRVPIERVVFLADEKSNQRFLAERMHDAWGRMADGSPNAGPATRSAAIAVTDYIARNVSQDQQGGTTVTMRLVARRSQTRRLVAAAQMRLDGTPIFGP